MVFSRIKLNRFIKFTTGPYSSNKNGNPLKLQIKSPQYGDDAAFLKGTCDMCKEVHF